MCWAGRSSFYATDRFMIACPAHWWHIPRGTVHGFQYGKDGGQMLEITGENATAAEMFAAVDQAIPPGPPDIPKLLRTLEENGVTVAAKN